MSVWNGKINTKENLYFMRTFKKMTACIVAAAAVMTSVAVTASADYQIRGFSDQNNSGKYTIRITGLPQSVFSDPQSPVIMSELHFENDGTKLNKFIVISYFNKVDTAECYIMDNSSNKYGTLTCNAVEFNNGEIGFLIQLDSNNEYLADFIKCSTGTVWFAGGYMDTDGQMKIKCYASNGDTVAQSYAESTALTWQELTSANNSDASSEPTSEPTSTPASEPTSEPASEPAASVPESTVTSTDNTAQQNPVTGIGGISLTFAAAAIAAGAVIVARKKK